MTKKKGMFKQLKQAKQMAKDINMEDMANPVKLMNDVMSTDGMQELQALAKGMDDGVMMLQEHIMIVQKNQQAFVSYFTEIDKRLQRIEETLQIKNETN